MTRRRAVTDRDGLFYGHTPPTRQEYASWGRQARGWAASTAYNYSQRVERADQWLRQHRSTTVDKAGPHDLESFLLAAASTANNRNGYHAALRAWYRYRRALYQHSGPDPTDVVGRIRPPDRLPEALTVEQAGRVLEAAGRVGPEWTGAYIGLLLFAALRRDEARLLRWNDVIDGKWVRFVGKGDRERVVPLHPAALELSRGWKAQAPDSRFVFARPCGQRPVSWQRVWHVVAAVGDAADVDRPGSGGDSVHWFSTRTWSRSRAA